MSNEPGQTGPVNVDDIAQLVAMGPGVRQYLTTWQMALRYWLRSNMLDDALTQHAIKAHECLSEAGVALDAAILHAMSALQPHDKEDTDEHR